MAGRGDMQAGCAPFSPCREHAKHAVQTTSHVGYLETRRAAVLLPRTAAEEVASSDFVGCSASARRWLASCCRHGRTAVSPANTTTTTVTPCTPPPGVSGPSQTHSVDRGRGDGDRAFLDFTATATASSPGHAARCGPCGALCVRLGRRLPGPGPRLRDLEGRCCFVLAIFTFMGMVVSLALFSDPLLLDLSTNLQRAQCATVNYTIVMGITNCTWASCRESCTTQAYKCPQIFVNYSLIKEGDGGKGAENETVLAVPLQVNMAGCGLDAVQYSCIKFNSEYMAVGRVFACEVAVDAAWPVAVPEAVRAQSSLWTWLGGVVPLALCVVCVLYIRARRLFTVEPVLAASLKRKRVSLRSRGATAQPRSFYKRRMAEMEEWRRRRTQLVLTGPGRGSTASRIHGEGDSDELVASEDQDEDDDLEDVVVGSVSIEPRPCYDDDDDDDVAVEMELPPTPPDSPEPPPSPPSDPPDPPPPPPCSPETSPPPMPDLVPVIVLESERGLHSIPEEVPLTPRAPRASARMRSGGSRSTRGTPSWRGEPLERSIQTVSGTVHQEQPYDISH